MIDSLVIGSCINAGPGNRQSVRLLELAGIGQSLQSGTMILPVAAVHLQVAGSAE
jgi:hypothetical protein